MLRYLICVLLSLLLTKNALGTCLNSSDLWVQRKIQDLETAVEIAGCQQYLAHGYHYERLHLIDGVAFDNVVVKKDNGHLTHFSMKLAIKAAKDGIVMLSPIPNPGANDLVFEIGFGIFVNQFTIVRVTKDSSNEVSRVSTPNILTTEDYTHFYIDISNDILTVGKRGEEPIITYSDIRLGTVKYFGVSSWGNNDAKFLYDCPVAN